MPAPGDDMFYGRTDAGHVLELHWDKMWAMVSVIPRGSSGYGRVLRSSGGSDLGDGVRRRVHMCAQNPCTARWPAAKYGLVGPPIHFQKVVSA